MKVISRIKLLATLAALPATVVMAAPPAVPSVATSADRRAQMLERKT